MADHGGSRWLGLIRTDGGFGGDDFGKTRMGTRKIWAEVSRGGEMIAAGRERRQHRL